MRVVVPVEARFDRTPDGRVWGLTPPTRSFWDRYLAVFDHVRVVARVRDVPAPPAGALRVDGDDVEVWPVPWYRGPGEYLTRAAAVRRAVRGAAGPSDAVIARVPSAVAGPLIAARREAGLPYALEVVGDPHEVFGPGVVAHPLRPLLRTWYTRNLRAQCREAAAVAYVTEHVLQLRYPASPTVVTAGYSSVDLPESAFAAAPRGGIPAPLAPVLVSIGSLDQLYKGIDTLIEAVAVLRGRGTAVRLVHAGDGRFRAALERLAAARGVADRVRFTGLLPTGAAVRDLLDAADLFVMPSRTEGQGRALIEAMARGLPAVGSAVGGIPEALDPADLTPPDDPAALAEAIQAFLTDPPRLAAASARNLARARDFAAATLAPRRTDFYTAVRRTCAAAPGRARR
ncbi:hypothetical protein Asp14428_35270 [Actinoplanes sp. NBRC 14428]|nr:hypothetical protein Asp14428_35270 [Actinoplanes sp. NBRC 14428]